MFFFKFYDINFNIDIHNFNIDYTSFNIVRYLFLIIFETLRRYFQ